MLRAEYAWSFVAWALVGCGARTGLDADELYGEDLGGSASIGGVDTSAFNSALHSGGARQSSTVLTLTGGRSGAGGASPATSASAAGGRRYGVGGYTSLTRGGAASTTATGGSSARRTRPRPPVGGTTARSSFGGATSGGFPIVGGNRTVGGASHTAGAGFAGSAVGGTAGSAATSSAQACERDADCADSVACTTDHCNLLQHRCENTPNSALCDDGAFCNGPEQCLLGSGCVPGSPACGDGVACTLDACDEGSDSCSFTPNDALCPISHACDPLDGCQARAFAHSSSTLYDVRLPSGRVIPIGSIELTDIALHPSGTLIGISFFESMVVDPSTAQTIVLARLANASLNALDAAPDGTLYGAGGSQLHTIDPLTGENTFVASLPSGMYSSGDLAFMQGRLLLSAHLDVSTMDQLLEFDFATNEFHELGSIGYSCVYGLAAFGPTLYGLTCNGIVLRIDPETGAGAELSRSSVSYWGATAR